MYCFTSCSITNASVTVFKQTPSIRVCKQTSYDSAAVHHIMTVNLTRQLLQDAYIHMLFDLLAIAGCYKMHSVYNTMLKGLVVA